MNCQECIDRLQDQLDGSPRAADGGLQAHLASCAECAARYAAARRLTGALRLMQPPVPPPELARRIAVAAGRSMRRRRLARRVTFAAAVAAAVLVAVGVGRLPFRGSPGGPPQANKQPTSPAALAQARPAVPPLRNTVADASNAVASLTTRTADEAMGPTRLFLPLVSRSALSKLEIPQPAVPDRPLREAGENISSGLGPVASSARRAVDLFLRDIPPVGGQTRGGS